MFVFVLNFKYWFLVKTDHKWIDLSSNDTVYLTSPNYPNHHPVRVNSTWYLTAHDQDGVYKITFLDLDLNVDYLQIGKTHDMLSGDTVVSKVDYWFSPETIGINHTQIWIRFSAWYWTETLRGFLIKVERTSQNEGIFMIHLFCLEHAHAITIGSQCLCLFIRTTAVCSCKTLSRVNDPTSVMNPFESERRDKKIMNRIETGATTIYQISMINF